MEGKDEALKHIESLKKLLLHEESSERSSSEEICALFVDLSKSVSSSAHHKDHKSGLSAISSTVEILVHGCSNHNHVVRGVASENLKKFVKKLMATNFSRIQQDLFHELKKNGDSRSVCAALDCFSFLFPLTRPSRCSLYAQSLVPVLLRLLCRHEEAVHEVLQDALQKIVPTLAPFMTMVNLKAIVDKVLDNLVSEASSYRRMASTVLTDIGNYSKKSFSMTEWLIKKLLDMGSGRSTCLDFVNAVLIILQHFFSSGSAVSFSLLKQSYQYAISCVLYRDANTVVSALECLHHLLNSSNSEFVLWLTSPLAGAQVAVDIWCNDTESVEASDSTSLQEELDAPKDNYFESDKNSSNSSLSGSVQDFPPLNWSGSELFCMALKDGDPIPLDNLTEYLLNSTLASHRVSTQSLGLACITCAVDMKPASLKSLDAITALVAASDPKLRSNVAKLLAVIIRSNLRVLGGRVEQGTSVISIAYKYLFHLVEDETAIVMKSVCEALRLCLPTMLYSTMYNQVLEVLKKLLPLSESSYWLTKTELLQTIGCLDFTILAMQDKKLPEKILQGLVFKLLGDNDHRVRASACECLVSLASNMTLDENLLLAHIKKKSELLFSDLRCSNMAFTFAGIAHMLSKKVALPPIGMEDIIWHLMGGLSSSEKPLLQRGCLEALHLLSVYFPPSALPEQWGCLSDPFTLMEMMHQLLKSSRLAWMVQTHCALLDFSSSILLSCGLFNMKKADKTWALGDDSLIQFANYFLVHNMKLLCLFVHVIEEREPEQREKKMIQLGVLPKRQTSDAVASNKSKSAQLLHNPTQLLPESLSLKPPLVAKDGIGSFANSLHFMRLFEACKAAYTNYQITLGSPGTDQFSKLLMICHKSLATLLEMALASDIGKYVEEMLAYLNYTVKIDSSGALLCVQQLLNALFGMNTAAQKTHLYSPFVSSLSHNIGNVTSDDGDGSLYSCLVVEPMRMMKKWLHFSSSTSAPMLSGEGRRRSSIVPLRKALTMRPVNSVSDIKDYIAYFEPLVVYALNLFPYTSSILFQQRVLFLVVQLLHLKVRYDLLDCNHSFYETVMKLTGLMESGMVKGGEALVPYLFQFLVLLSSDQSKLVTIPQVMQICDSVMASGHNVTTFAVPALQPLVLNLFVRSTHLSADIETQREVAVNMLLKLVEHSRVIMLLTHVLDYYRGKQSRWNEVSSQIYCAILPCIENLQIVLDIREASIALYQLFMAMDPETVSLYGLLSALLKPARISSSTCLLRWLSLVSLMLELMASVFSDRSLLNIRALEFRIPEFKCPLITVSQLDLPTASSSDSFCVASFLTGTLRLAANCLYQVCVQNCGDDYEQLPSLVANMLLLLRILPDRYPMLKQALSELSDYEELSRMFLSLSTFFPLLALHYLNFLLLVKIDAACWMAGKVIEPCDNPISKLLQHGSIALACSQAADSSVLLRLLIASPSWYQSEVALVYLSCAKQDPEIRALLRDSVRITGKEEASQLLHYLYILSQSLSPSTLGTLCCDLVVHPLSVIGQTSQRVANKYLQDQESAISTELARELIQSLELQSKWAPDLISKLSRICAEPPSLDDQLEVSSAANFTQVFSKEWYIKKIAEFCSSGTIQDNGRRVHMLSNIEKDDLDAIFAEANIALSLLESCIVHGIRLTLNSKTTLQYSNSVQPGSSTTSFDYMHPLLEVSVKEVVSKLRHWPLEDGLIRCCVRLLAATHQFHNGIFQDADVLDTLRDFSLQAFMKSCNETDPLVIQSSMDCCTLVLHLPSIQRSISEQWARNAVNSLCTLIPRVLKNLPKAKTGSAGVSQSNSESTDMECAKQKLLSVLSAILNREVVSLSPSFHCALEMFTFTLCRLPIWHGLVITPPVLKKEGIISDNLLDEALKECEVLLEYMQRCNSLGWLTRAQFEERWMQLLGVINQPLPSEGAGMEEYHAHYINVCAGLRAITSLLCCTMLRPCMGDPTSSVLMHLHRNNEMIFLVSRLGRKFLNVRKRLELEILSECGVRANLYDYYQSPLLSHYSSTCYPPLYSKNIEREIGATTIGFGQLSMRSLWPIVLKQKSSSGYHSDSEEVDVKSCILSLVDLYMHWLTRPVNALLLAHVLASAIMLSDLFAASDQFEWMLQTLLNLYESHPHEDVSTLALIVVGILKTTAVLKASHTDSERQIKIIERSLTSETMIQCACLQGILYLSEDSNNNVLPNCIPSITKYILRFFKDILSYSDKHVMILWSVTVVIITDYSQYIKDQSFVSRILDATIQLMNNPNASTSLFHCFSLGLEFLVLNFSLSTQEKASVLHFATNRFIKTDRNKSLATLALLLVCMYTGEEADVVSGLVEASYISTETAIQAREQINNLMEKLRHGSEINTDILVDVLPQIITEFLSPMEVLQTVVTDFISPHQSRPEMSAAIMSETFLLLLNNGHQAILNEWILLSLESFVQQEPESRAVWSITCLFLAASTTDACRSLFPLVCHWKHFSDSEVLQLLCIATESFYIGQCDQQKQDNIRMKFKSSNYLSLIKTADYCCI